MKLVTWNIQWGRGADGRVDLPRIIQHAHRVADFDVLCLQEVSAGFPELSGCDGSDQFVTLARLLPGFTAIHGIAVDVPHPAGGRRSFGNMILSRLPVLQVFRHLLPWPAEPGIKSMQRIALEATLETPHGPLRVTTTHLEYYSEKQRHAQVERLRSLHQEACAHARIAGRGTPAEGPFFEPARGGPAVLAGDFNMLPDAPDRALLTAAIDAATPRYRDAWELLYPQRARPPTVGLHDKVQWPGAPFTFDYIFVSEDLATSVKQVHADAASDASDHQPMLLELIY